MIRRCASSKQHDHDVLVACHITLAREILKKDRHEKVGSKQTSAEKNADRKEKMRKKIVEEKKRHTTMFICRR